MTKSSPAGFTIIELMIAVAFGVILILSISSLIAPVSNFFRQSKQRQEVNTGGRVVMETVTRVLQLGLAKSVNLCGCTNMSAAFPACGGGCPTSSVPFSRIEFSLQGGTTSYAIYLGNDQTAEMDMYVAGFGQPVHQVLSKHVTGITFSGNPEDPAVIDVNLQMTNADDPKHPSSTIVKSQVHMIATQ